MSLQIASIFKVKPTPAPDALPPVEGVKQFFSIQILCFNYMGIDPTSVKNTYFNPFLLWFLMLMTVPFWIFMLICGIESRDNLELATDALAPFCQSGMIMVKMANFIWNRKRIVKLARDLWLWSLEATEEELKIIEAENRSDRSGSVLYFNIVLTTAVIAFVKPVILACFSYVKGYSFMDSPVLPLKIAYHIILDTTTVKGYIWAYLWNIVAVYLLFFGVVASDTLFTWFSHNVSAQFRILNQRLKNTANYKNLKRDETGFTRSLIDNIKYHQRVIELADNFKEIFMVTMFFKYAIIFLQIGFIIFQIVGTDQWSVIIYHISFLLTVSLQLLMYCRGGQRIIDQSSSIAEAINQNFQWHDMSNRSKKLLLLPLMRAQKPCSLTGFFFVADMHSFMMVYRTAGSLLTMLKSVE